MRKHLDAVGKRDPDVASDNRLASGRQHSGHSVPFSESTMRTEERYEEQGILCEDS